MGSDDKNGKRAAASGPIRPLTARAPEMRTRSARTRPHQKLRREYRASLGQRGRAAQGIGRSSV